MTQAKTADEIRREMASLRGQLQEPGSRLVENARVLGDWRYYVRRFPWPCLSAAALAGFLLVPRRLEVITWDTETLLDVAEEDRVQIEPKPRPQESGPSGVLVPLLLDTVTKAAVAFAGQQVGKILGRRAAEAETT